MCTNALLLKEKLHLFKPTKYLCFSVHLDGERSTTIFPCAARVDTTSRWRAFGRGGRGLPRDDEHDAVRRRGSELGAAHFDQLMEAGRREHDGLAGYTYDKAPDQKHFLGKARSRKLFRSILSNRKKTWRFNTSPLFRNS